MNGFGGAGAFSDGKYNLTNDFGGTLYEYIGKKQAMELMHYVERSTSATAARTHGCIPRPTARSRLAACNAICICSMRLSGTLERTSILSC